MRDDDDDDDSGDDDQDDDNDADDDDDEDDEDEDGEKDEIHFISFQSLASLTNGHGTQTLYWRGAKQKDRTMIFHCFKLDNKASSRSTPPTASVASLYTLHPQEFFGRPRRCGCSTTRSRRVWPENTHRLLAPAKSRAATFPKRINWRQVRMLEIFWRLLRFNTVLFEILLT